MKELKLNGPTFPVDIVMVTWNRPKITALAIKTIYDNTKRQNYRLIVIDNGSPKEMQGSLEVLRDNGYIDELVLNDENTGLEPARNQGLALVKSEYFICADNDCLPPKMQVIPRSLAGVPPMTVDWIETMVKLMELNPEYAAISARTPIMIGTGNIFEEADKNGDEIVEFPHPGGSLRIMTVPTVLDAGGWRNDMPGRGSEERHICGKLREMGWKTGFATHVVTLHLFGDPDTDNWGYPKDWKPEDSGHSPGVWHPIFASGDDPEAVAEYTT